jgi:hypothetical protein
MIKGLLLASTLFLTACWPVPFKEPSKVPLMNSAVFLDLTNDEHCSGTAVGKDLLLTAAHCFRDSKLEKINDTPVTVIATVADGMDHVLARVSPGFETWATINPKLPESGERLRWMGNPGDLRFAFREGRIATVGVQDIYIDGRTFSGDSGSGLFNDAGEVVGVVSGAVVMSTDNIFHPNVVMQLVRVLPLAFSDKELRGEF